MKLDSSESSWHGKTGSTVLHAANGRAAIAVGNSQARSFAAFPRSVA